MKVFEIIDFLKGPLKKLADAGITSVDYRLAEMYKEYIRLKTEGLKVSYIVSYLSDQYGMSERSIYSALKKMERDI